MKKNPWDIVPLARELIRYPSVTPADHGVQDKLAERLASLGFTVHPLPFGEVKNFYARRGTRAPLFCFAGHTDVVPPGPEEEWTDPPFSGVLKEEILYGRGAADMKGAIAAMLSAVGSMITEGTLPENGSIGFLVTGDEEGPALDGTAKVIEWLKQRGEKIDFCLVGEPTSEFRLGDTVKTGRRGSINGRLVLHGIQGHVAYPHLSRNPLHEGLDILRKLAGLELDKGNGSFQPSRLVLTNLNGGTGRDNVTPDRLEARFNIRYGTASTYESILEKIENLLRDSGLKYSLSLDHAGKAFLTGEGKLVQSLLDSVNEVQGFKPALSTSGGTSDARFIAPAGIETAELGLKNETIHKKDEAVAVADLEALKKIYQKLLKKLLV